MTWAPRPNVGAPSARAVALALAMLGTQACERTTPPPVERVRPAARTDLRPVARTRIAELSALVGSSPTVEPDEELRERTQGLLETLAGANEALKRIAREELGTLGPAATAVLHDALFDGAAAQGVRIAAAQALGEIDTPAAVEALVARIELPLTRQDPDGWLRAHCAWRLGGSMQDWIVPRLILTLRYEKHDETVVYLARTLAHFGVYCGLDALYVVAGRSQEHGALAQTTLAELARAAGRDDPFELLQAWRDGSSDPLPQRRLTPVRALEIFKRIARFAEWQLRGVDDSRFVLSREHALAAPLLAEALDDENRYIRAHAAQCLERMGRRAAAAGPKLLEVLDDPEIGDQVLLTLGAVGHAPAEPALVERTSRAHSMEIRVAAARALGLLARGSSAPTLRSLCEPTEPLDLRVAALCALAACAPRELDESQARALLEHLSSGQVDTAGPEQALERWLEARTDQGRWSEALDAWRTLQTQEPRARVEARAALVRAAFDSAR